MKDNIGGVSMEDIMAAAMSGLDDEQTTAQTYTKQESDNVQENTTVDETMKVPVSTAAPVVVEKTEKRAATTTAQTEETSSKVAIVPVTPVSPVPQIQLRDFHCNNCGSPLKIPKNSRGLVVCPDCRTEAVIEGLVKNAEIADKENINSGVSLSTDMSTIHNIVVDAMLSSPAMPIDIFEKSVVLREEHIYIPAYLYYCNGTISFTYEAGNQREHKTAIDLGDKTRVEWEKYMEWTQMNGMASAVDTAIASGNKEFATIIQELYDAYGPNDLIDVEDLELPFDVQTYNYNLPQSAAFNEYVRPQMEELLDIKAEESLSGKTYKNLSTSGGYNIHKDEIIRIFLGVYKVVYSYNGQEYAVYVTGDGRKNIYIDVPVDSTRASMMNSLNNEKAELVSKISKYRTAIIIFAILTIPTFGLGLIGVIFFAKKKKELELLLTAKQNEIDAFMKEIDSAEIQFRQKQGALNGIYQGII